MMSNNINKLVKDDFLKNETNNFTRNMLKKKMSLNKICFFLKDYITKYNYIKENTSKEMWEKEPFTMKLWWESGQRGGNKFAISN
jgi:hypothetical protein